MFIWIQRHTSVIALRESGISFLCAAALYWMCLLSGDGLVITPLYFLIQSDILLRASPKMGKLEIFVPS
jgi:hypothetical protein